MSVNVRFLEYCKSLRYSESTLGRLWTIKSSILNEISKCKNKAHKISCVTRLPFILLKKKIIKLYYSKIETHIINTAWGAKFVKCIKHVKFKWSISINLFIYRCHLRHQIPHIHHFLHQHPAARLRHLDNVHHHPNRIPTNFNSLYNM